MAGNKTIDGIRIVEVVRAAVQMGARAREGRSHDYVLNFPNMRACPVDTSTHAEYMVAKWLARATGRDKQEVYQAIRQGGYN